LQKLPVNKLIKLVKNIEISLKEVVLFISL